MSERHFGFGHCPPCELSLRLHKGCPAMHHSLENVRPVKNQVESILGPTFDPERASLITRLIHKVEAAAGYDPFDQRPAVGSEEYIMSMMYAFGEGVSATWREHFGRIVLREHNNGGVPHYSFGVELLNYPIIIPGYAPIVRAIPCVLDGSKVHMLDSSIALLGKAMGRWSEYGSFIEHYEIDPRLG